MNYSLEIIIFVILLIDSLAANIMVWFGKKWYVHHLRTFSRQFPPVKGWAGLYLVLVLWIGVLMAKFGAL